MRQSNHSLSPTAAGVAIAPLSQVVCRADTISQAVDTVLARVCFNASVGPDQPGCYQTGLAAVAPVSPREEWLAAAPRHGEAGAVRWSRAGGFTFAAVSRSLSDGADVSAVTHQLYLDLLQFLQSGDHPHLLRFWNYVPAINRGDGDDEVYKRFCTGRLRAFREMAVSEAQFPAASAVGCSGDRLTVQVLAGAHAGEHHGNHNQMDAFAYPRQYGISSPSFARATSVTAGSSRLLFVSGTASIVGHATRYPHQLDGQVQVTVDNMMSLLEQTGKAVDELVSMRVYLRNPADRDAVDAVLSRTFSRCQKIYVQAEICRADLLLEVECFCR